MATSWVFMATACRGRRSSPAPAESAYGPGQPVPDLLTAGGIDRCSAGPGCEVVAVGEPGEVTDVGQDAGGVGEADPGRSIGVRAACLDRGLELLGQACQPGDGDTGLLAWLTAGASDRQRESCVPTT